MLSKDWFIFQLFQSFKVIIIVHFKVYLYLDPNHN